MQKMKLTDDDGKSVVVDINMRDVLKWEKLNVDASFARLTTNPTAQDFYTLACLAAKRLHLFKGTHEEFEDTYDLEPVVEEPSFPTKEAAQTED